MSLNKDNPIINSFINTAQQDLKNIVDNIESRILQICQSCGSAKECYEKVPAQANELPGDLKTLDGTLEYQLTVVSNENPDEYAALEMIAGTIGQHYRTTFAMMQSYPESIAQAIYVASDMDNGDQIYPDNLKVFLDHCFSSVHVGSMIFFDWLRNQPTPQFVTGQ